MINTQLGRRNLPPAQRIAVVKKFEKKIQEQANEKYKQTVGRPKEKIHTDRELAKLAGVGTGTIARFNRVMNSDNEDLKKKLLADEVKINAVYEKVREQEKEKENN